MPKPKQFLKPKPKHGKKEADAPETENDFLELADEHEKAAGKWRAGDVQKCKRFFQRAIDTYDAGLRKYPKSFDLAYNKCLLQFQISQDPRVAAVFGDTESLLRETLDSHRHALHLKEDNPDILFNTAQVLTSLAEVTEPPESIKYLHEAVELFSSCLSRQELDYQEMQTQMQEAGEAETSEPAQASIPAEEDTAMGEDPESEQPEQWASIVEPVTPEQILETALAQLQALTTLLETAGRAGTDNVDAIDALANTLINEKIPAYLSLIPESAPADPAAAVPSTSGPTLSISTTTTTFTPTAADTNTPTNPRAAAAAEASLAIANYTATSATTSVIRNLLPPSTALSQITNAFAPLTSPTNTPPPTADTLSAHADALLSLASTISTLSPSTPTLRTRWHALTQAQDSLGRAAQAPAGPAPTSKAAIYLARGDAELHRHLLVARWPAAVPASVAAGSADVLRRNAGVYYRGADRLAGGMEEAELREEARVKAWVVAVMEGGGRVRGVSVDVRPERVADVLGLMVEEGLVEGEWAEGVLREAFGG